MVTTAPDAMWLDTRTKANRKAIADLLVTLAASEGATASVEPAALNPRALWVRIAMGSAWVCIQIDKEPGFLVPWNVDLASDAKFSGAFGAAVRAEVNPVHRRKCMACYSTATHLVLGIENALRCIAEGKAFQ